jgi:hypothetical protein
MDVDQDNKTSSVDSESIPLEFGSFCELIRKPVGPVRIPLKVVGDEIHQLLDAEPLEQDMSSAPSISLAKVLEEQRLYQNENCPCLYFGKICLAVLQL